MVEFRLVEAIGSIENGIERANRLYWDLALFQRGPLWIVGGDKPVLVTDNREVADAFLYGMALAYGVLPDEIYEQLAEEVRKLVE